jgi:hypothetical protein
MWIDAQSWRASSTVKKGVRREGKIHYHPAQSEATMKREYQGPITAADIDSLTKKLADFAATLGDKEQFVLMGVLELAGKMYEGTAGKGAPKKTLPLVRETIRELNVWDRLIETQGWSLWTCDRPPRPGDDVINPK